MQGQRGRRCALALIVLIAIVGSSSPCFSVEPAHRHEFFAARDSQPPETPAPLFVIDEENKEVDDNLLALASAAASSSSDLQYGSGPGLRSYRGRSPLETGNGAFFKTMGVSMFIAAAGDLTTTELGLQTPGVVEMNPLQRNRGIRVATHLAVPVFVYWLTKRAHKNGDGKLALLIRIGANVAYSYAAMHNARTLAGLP